MKCSRKLIRGFGWISMLFLLLGSPNDFGAIAGKGDSIPDLDARSSWRDPIPDSLAAIAQLTSRVPDARVDFDELLGTPGWVRAANGFLTGRGGEGRGVSARTLAGIPSSDPDRVTKAFITDQHDLFGHGVQALESAQVKRQFLTAHNGLRTVVWQQQVDGISVFEALLVSHTTSKGELVSISSRFVPDPITATGLDNTSRAVLLANPPISARRAVALAAGSVGETISPEDLSVGDGSIGPIDREQRFGAAAFEGEADAHLVWLPMDRTNLRLCWEVLLMSRAQDRMYRVLIDARTGERLLRHCLTENLSNASYLVYTQDSPTPMSPGYSTPVTNQPAAVAQVLVVTNAFDTNASPNGWINDGGNQTQGNNVDAYMDHDGDGQPDLPRPQGSPFRVFAVTNDLTQDPLNFVNAAVINLFYWNNWMHDKLYELGFTEAAGNFQSNNFSRGGLGGDAVLASAQTGGSGGSDNNAHFTTPPDGMPGLMQMYIFNGPTPNRDGDFDTQVILHEYTHGLSNRRVGGGVGITANQSLGLGEGWSDFYSLALLTKPGNDVNGTYPEGSYVAYQYNGLQQNYYFGIRRYPYCTDKTKCPGTFKDIDPGQYSAHPGIPCNPALSNAIPSMIPVDEKHNVGEIWCDALWDARANLIGKYGFAGNQIMLQLVTDAMNLTPANPTFVQARDALIQADIVDTGGENYKALWQAFAKRGIGYGAVAPPSSTCSGVVESFLLPDDMVVIPQTNLIAMGIEGGAFTPVTQACALVNTGTNTFNWSAGNTAAWLTLSSTNGTLTANGGSNTVLISLNAAASALPLGVYSATLAFTNQISGIVQSRLFTLTIRPPAIYSFALNSDPGWPRQGAWAFGHPTGSGGAYHGFPDPNSGATGSNVFGVNLNGDYSTAPGGPFYLTAGPLNFSASGNITLQFERWLNSDVQNYAAATVDVANDGTNWTNVFANGATVITDSSWTNCQYDLSAVADAQPTVYVRWGYQISMGAFPYSGWNIDEISFLGLDKIRIALPASATKGDGTLHNAGTILLPHAPPANVTFALTSSDTTKLMVPNSVTVLAGQTNTAFDVTVIDNGLLDGTQLVFVRGSNTAYTSGTNSITIFDNQTATLSVSLPSSATEGDPPLQGMITSSAAPANDIAVSLSSSDPVVQLPATIFLPAGQTTALFTATVVDDHKIDGDRNVTVTAHVRNWTDGVAMILVHDIETTNLTLVLPSQAWASNGTITNGGRVEISGTLTTNLPVTLSSSDSNHLVIPSGIMILAGQTSAVFNVTVVDTGAFGTIPILVDSSASGFVDGMATVSLNDDQTPPPPFNPSPPNLSSNNPVVVQLAWSAGIGEGVEQLANGDFEAGSLVDWSGAAGTNGGFVIDDGTLSPPSGDSPTPPFAGSFCCVASCAQSGSAILYRDVALPANAGKITLSWADRVRNFGSTFATNQQFRVEVRNTNNATLAVPYFSEPTDTLLADWNVREADLTTWRGQTVRLAFIVNAGQAYLDVHLDNVSVRVSNLSPVTYDVYWGTNSAPGPSQLLGSTTNTYWPLPPVSPLIQYYWQIAASRANQTTGSVWEFSSLATVTFSNVSVVAGFAGPTNAVFSLQLDSPNTQAVSVDFVTTDGTAAAGTDYVYTNGTLTFNPGETNKPIVVFVTGNTNGGAGEAFFLTLANPVTLLLGTTQAVCSIVNGYNTAPTLPAISNRTVHAGYTLTFTVRASDTDMDTMTYSLDPGAPAGANIDPNLGTFTWTPGSGFLGTTNAITVRATDNGLPPLSAASTFSVIVVAPPRISTPSFSSGHVALAWSAIPGQTYRVQYKTNLLSAWNNLSGDVTANSSSASKVDLSATGGQRFYRVLVLP
jgi:Fungalysin metallopeptidase (M36)/Calx-beta domain/Fungalysin/Thermolysin Propeptide Motif